MLQQPPSRDADARHAPPTMSAAMTCFLVPLPLPSWPAALATGSAARASAYSCAAAGERTPAAPRRRPRRPRKPNHYWQDMENIRAELLAHLESSGAPAGAARMPTAPELRAATRQDLISAINKAGGFKRVAAELGFVSARQAFKPAGFWNDPENVHAEVRKFIAERKDPPGMPQRMPTLAELRAAGRSDLETAVRKNGGFRRVAAAIGISSTAKRREDGYWRDFAVVKAALEEFVAARDEKQARLGKADRGKMVDEHRSSGGRKATVRMPTLRELRNAGRADLAQAISEFHGGFGAVSVALGYRPWSTDLTEFYQLAQELLRFCREEMDNLPVMPNSGTLRKHGRADLLAAISKHGGMAPVSQRLGLQYIVRTREIYKDWDAFQRGLLSFTESHGTSGHMPSSRELRNFNRSDLYQGILYWGGPRVVGSKVGLAVSNYWQYFHFVGAEILDFIDKHGIGGVMPTEAEFLEMGQVTLNVSTAKFGYSQVAQRLGLKEVRQTAEVALTTMRNRSLFYDDDGDDDEDMDVVEDDPLADSEISLDDLKLPGLFTQQ